MSLVKFPKTLSDHPSLIGIIRFPKSEVETTKMVIPYIEEKDGKFTQKGQEVQMALAIYGEEKTSNTFSIPKANQKFIEGSLTFSEDASSLTIKFTKNVLYPTLVGKTFVCNKK